MTEVKVFECELNDGQLDALFSDLNAGAEVLRVQVRMASGDEPRDQTTSLADAQQWMRNGKINAIQVRYRFDGLVWVDTLLVIPNAVRLIRASLPDSAA